MKNLLLATNLSPNSLYALERALLVARLHRADLHVVHVAPGGGQGAEEELGRQVAAAVDYLESALSDDFGAGFFPASFKSVTGDPVQSIVEEAAACNADLIVTGLSERAPGAGFVDGTILEGVLMSSARPAIVVKARPTRHYENVMVGLDLSPSSRHAYAMALRIAPTADFTIAHANEGGSDLAVLRKELLQVARQCVAEVRRDVGMHEGAIDVRIEDGSVAEVLDRCARNCAPDLVAFGKHNRASSHRPYIGSGARSVLEMLDADMLVVPPGSAQDDRHRRDPTALP